jgi:hypothetical protein
LTADSDQPYALTEIERGFLIVIAGALAAGMAHVDTLESKAHNDQLGSQAHEADGGGSNNDNL